MQGVKPDVSYHRFSDGQWAEAVTTVPREMALAIFVEQQELVTLLCTPTKLNCLVVGYLYSEGIINSLGDISSLRLCEDECLADVRLSKPGFKLPEHRVLTTGCGSGVSFRGQPSPVELDAAITPEQALSLTSALQQQQEIFRHCGGVHTSALADGEGLVAVAEDVGRHNTLDKLLGERLFQGLATRGCFLLTTGRLSSEMVLKAARMETPIVLSRTAPTDRGIVAADNLGITLIGYVRGNRISVYTHQERVKLPETSAIT